MSGVRSQRTEPRTHMSDGRSQKTEVRGQRKEGERLGRFEGEEEKKLIAHSKDDR